MAHHAAIPSRGRGKRYLFWLGLSATMTGFFLLLLPMLDRAWRPAGAVAMLLGVVMVGVEVLGRLRASMTLDRGPSLPAWGGSEVTAASAGLLGRLAQARVAVPVEVQVEPAELPLLAATAPGLAPPSAAGRLAAPQWNGALFEHMSAQQFERVCEALFAQGGFETRCQPHGTGDGLIVWLYSRHAQSKDSPAAVAYCRQGAGQPVDARDLQPLLELMRSRQLKRGTCASSSDYTGAARRFAQDSGINLMDRAALLSLIGKRTPEQQLALLALALN